MRANDSSVRARSSNFYKKKFEVNFAAKRPAMTFPFSSSQLPVGYVTAACLAEMGHSITRVDAFVYPPVRFQFL
jgi:hypothetical protein